jgi:hypothetical protein
MKISAARCIRQLNIERFTKKLSRISGSSKNIVNLLKIYNFYKASFFRRSLKKQKQKQKQNQNRQTNTPTNMPKIVAKGGYKFILLDGLYYKLTKKSYSQEEIEKWCAGRESASSKMKMYHKEKKTEREKKENDQATKTNAIYKREILNYPEALRELFAQ